MQNLEISPKELLSELRQVSQLVSKIHVDIEVLKTQVLHKHSAIEEKVKSLEEDLRRARDDIKTTNDKIALRDRAIVTSLVAVGFGAIVTFLTK